MDIPTLYSERCIYHFTHINNLSGLMKNGLLSNNNPSFPKENVSIAENEIQNRRSKMKVTCSPHGVVHDYVPLYFGSLSPMLLAVIKKKKIDQSDIIYIEFPLSIIKKYSFVFTNASANTEVPPDFFNDPKKLNHLNWDEIDSKKWSCKNDTLKHQRMAELLIKNSLPITEATRIVVWSKEIKDKITKQSNNLDITLPEIQVFDNFQTPHYFTDFLVNKYSSCVAGPNEVFNSYKHVIQHFKEKNNHITFKYKDIRALIDRLRVNFGDLHHTNELIGLEPENPVHNEDVSQHTIRVVKILLKSEKYHNLPIDYKICVEIAAYLHDIGKGPKSRWVENNGKQKTDDKHPVRAKDMLVDIFCNQVENVSYMDVKRITFLVLYHDFFGDAMGNYWDKIGDNRSHLEIKNRFIYNYHVIDMLLALSKADSLSLSNDWWSDEKADRLKELLIS
ncbi:DarT ssDNA thymidine ADP-ribosyltransferase family protein [Morganella morganii]|uniref:DarT ssDNA thymidine ADP-ribosyltransferase family protein n=1 Tax=Morganella morganii TaxID=582 RepID=UPI00090FECAC|nr:DarT ssDNA thymidine ADP-ribosyltransferase family protein [Morganella morganii]SHL91435.1 HD domain-containing protein [Morganella morganii]